jgi:uncharacterized repeat protein (TIGR03843 family)
MAGDLRQDLAERLAGERIRLVGRFVEASNLTLLGELPDGTRCVVKPVAGEQPLWDFPDGTLAGREAASWLLAVATGWDAVPVTIVRELPDAGPASVQEFASSDGAPVVGVFWTEELPHGWRPVVAAQDEQGRDVVIAHVDSRHLRRLALLDVLLNNADRKGSHILSGADGRVLGIDHGLTFHVQDKLRTVLWGFAGEHLDDELCSDLHRLAGRWPADALAWHLGGGEVAAARRRLDALRSDPRFPQPGPGWPRLPWPPL